MDAQAKLAAAAPPASADSAAAVADGAAAGVDNTAAPVADAPTAPAPPAPAASTYGGPGWCPVKPEHLVPKEKYLAAAAERQARASAVLARAAAAAAADGSTARGDSEPPPSKKQRSNQQQHHGGKGGQNKARDTDDLGYGAGAAAQFCRNVMLGKPCRYGDRCRNSHDLAGYLAAKPADLGPRCYVWDVYGSCPAGVSCRFGDSHTDRATGAQLTKPGAAAAGVGAASATAPGSSSSAAGAHARPHLPLNVLPYGMMLELQKRRYRFLRSPAPHGWKGAAGGGGGGGGGGNNKAAASSGVGGGGGATSAPPAPAPEADAAPAAAAAAEAVAPEAADAAADAGTVRIRVRREGKFRLAERKRLDFRGQVYVGPLTTVGNLPFRRIMVEQGADITIGEMAMSTTIADGSQGEWALLRRHASERVFGVQLAGGQPDVLSRCAELIHDACESVDFIDLNMGCPLDGVCAKGMGAALMGKPGKLRESLRGMARATDIPLTLKMRTGLETNPADRFAHRLVQRVRLWSAAEAMAEGSPAASLPPLVSAVAIHGRTRQQRYSRLADWGYISSVVAAARGPVHLPERQQLVADGITAETVALWGGVDGGGAGVGGGAGITFPGPSEHLPPIPIIGNGDILSWEDYYCHLGGVSGSVSGSSMNSNNGAGASDDAEGGSGVVATLLARGALIKPWLPREIKERVTLDPRSSERLEMLRSFVHYGLEHWGSDQAGVNRTRRFLLEWLSFTCRYVPPALLERLPQRMNDRPPAFYGRDDLETLMASQHAEDWVKISELLLGPVPDDFSFVPKHKSNSYYVAEDPGARVAISAAAVHGGAGAKRDREGDDDDSGEAEG